jgi:ABC-2 type transport system ATP-binding protein
MKNSRLEIRGLSKSYTHGVQALKNINLNINQGMFGLLGPNGAGKSTLMRIMATLQEADEGSVTLDELDVLNQKEEVRKILGYLPQEFNLYPKMEAQYLLDHLALIKGMIHKKEREEMVETLLHKTNLWKVRKNKLGSFSGGMKQRFGIAQSLLANPQLIIVDEPTAGLDPIERNRFLNLLAEVSEKAIVILSTHIVEDVEALCSFMAILHQGELLYNGRTSDALDQLKGKIWKKQVTKNALPEYRKNFNVISERLVAGAPVIHVISEQNPDDTFKNIEASLEDVYFARVTEESLIPSDT